MSAFTTTTRQTADISVFYNHELQSILALFLTKPDLYKDYATTRNRQDYFFYCFGRFVVQYHHFSGDETVYFASVRKEVAGEANICGGGGGKMSGASSRYFKNRYNQLEEARNAQIDQFSKKYGIVFKNGQPDSRLFVGVTEIWNKLDNALAIVAASEWSTVVENSYDDATFTAPIPKTLNKLLVPLSIRNRAVQKCRSMKSRAFVSIRPLHNEDEEEDEPVEKPEPITEPGSKILLVLPEIDDDEW